MLQKAVLLIQIPKDEIEIPKELLEPCEIIDYVKGTFGNLELLFKSCDDVCDPVIDVPNDEPCVVESETADKPRERYKYHVPSVFG